MFKMSWLLSSWVILFSVIGGILVGIYNPKLAMNILPIGDLYLKLLQMLVLPMLMTAVISALGNLFISGMHKSQIIKIITFMMVGLLVASLAGTLFGYFGKTGLDLSYDAQVTLGKTIMDTEGSDMLNQNLATPKEEGLQLGRLFVFLEDMIPSNIFYSLTQGDSLSILFFSVILGVSLGLMRTASARQAILGVETFFNVFLDIIDYFMYLLPIGLFCLFAGQIAQTGVEIIWAMASLIIYIHIACFCLMLIYSIIIWWKVRHLQTYFQSIASLRHPIIVALGTASSLATVPAAIEALRHSFKVDKNVCDLVIPLGTTLNPPGSVLQFAISSVFIAQLYGADVTITTMAIIAIGSILAGLASSCAPGVIALSMIAIILEPLNLPTSVAIILLAAIDAIVDPILTALNVYANCAMTIVADEKDSKEPKILTEM